MRRTLSSAVCIATLSLSVLACTARARPIEDLPDYKRNWEDGWSDRWRLVEISEAEIDHYRPGIVLNWQMDSAEGTWNRTDAFTPAWEFYWGHEEFWVDDRLVARGPIFIAPDGTRLFRILGFLGEVVPGDPLNDQILFEELHLFSMGEVQCKYRSSSNFIGTGSGPMRGIRRVPDDTTLLSGSGCPGIAVLQSNPFRDRLPE